jgi:hypothetical protein
MDDYEVVRELVADLVSAGVQATVPAIVRETVNAVSDLNVGASGVAGTEVAKRLKLDKSAAKRRLDHAAQLGYVRNAEERKGRPARWIIDEPMPDDVEVLPAPERLADSDADRARREAEILDALEEDCQ